MYAPNLLVVLSSYSQRATLHSWNDVIWKRQLDNLGHDTSKLALTVIQTHDIDIINLCFTKLPVLECDGPCLGYVLLTYEEDDPVFKFVLNRMKPRMKNMSFAKLNLKSHQLSVALFQKACRSGVKMQGVATLLICLDKLIRNNDRVIRRIAKRHDLISNNIIEEQHRLCRALRYMLIHCKVTQSTFYKIIANAKTYDNIRLLRIYKQFLSLDQIKEIEAKYNKASGLGTAIDKIRTKKLNDFVMREIRPNGKLDRLLYQPPEGLMIRRSMRLLELQ